MKKVLFSCLLAAVVLLGATSCDFFKHGMDFREADDVAKIAAIIENNLNEGELITSLVFHKTWDDSNFSFSKGIVKVYYVKAENPKEELMYNIDLKKNGWYDDEVSEKHKRTLYGNNRGYPIANIADLGCDKIADFVNKAIEMMAAEDLKAYGIGLYTIYPHSDPAKITHTFAIEKIAGGGGNHTINYVEYDFEVKMGDGEVVSK